MANEFTGLNFTEMPELTPEIFGHLLPVIWRAVTGRDYMPSQDEVRDVLICSDAEIPRAVLNCMHVEFRLDGPIIEEYTDYITSAQEAGIIERPNPSMVSIRIKLDPVQAANLMDQYAFDFPTEVDWLRERVNAFSSNDLEK